jgi:hypothetical protein
MNFKYKNTSIKRYIQIIELAISEGYNFSFFNSNIDLNDIDPKIYLRKDIDFNPDLTLRLADIDYEYGIKSSYFVRVNAPNYNFLAYKTLKILNNLIEKGNEVHLHLDVSMITNHINSLEEIIEYQKQIYKIGMGFESRGVSLHTPSSLQNPNDLNFEISKHFEFNTYSDQFFKEIKYISDSGGSFNYDQPENVIKDRSNLQLLIHPIWYYEHSPSENW